MFKGVAKGVRTNSAYAPGSRARKGVVPGLFRRFAGNIKFLRSTFILYTEYVGAGFFINLPKSGQVCYWDAGDGQSAFSNTLNITYTAVGIKKVTCKLDHPELVTSLSNFSSAGFVGTIDLRRFTGIGVNSTLLATSNPNLKKILFPALNINVGSVGAGFCSLEGSVDISMINGNFQQIIFSGNPKLTQIVLPKFGKTCSYFYISNCPINGTLDTTGLVLDGYFDAGFCNFQKVLFATSAGVFSTGFYLNGCNYLAGIVDLSMLSGLCVDIRLNNNALVTGYSFGASSNVVTQIILSGNSVLATLDLSPFSKLGGAVTTQSCPLLTSVTFPTSTQLFSSIILEGCKITGTLNVSGLSGLGGTFRCENNALLTGITFPASISGSANALIFFAANNCNITGTLNLSVITKLNGDLVVSNNTLLTAITLPSNTLAMTSFAAVNCTITTINFTSMPKLTEVNGCVISLGGNSMTAAQVNAMLIDLDTNATNAFTGRSITIAGSNAAPTGLGLTAKASLITKGFTVTTN